MKKKPKELICIVAKCPQCKTVIMCEISDIDVVCPECKHEFKTQ